LRPSRVIVVVGSLWGLAGPLLVGLASRGAVAGPFGFGPAVVSATLELLGADHFILPIKLALLPMALGADVAAWTLGVVLWPLVRCRWPGEGLSRVLDPIPLISWVVSIAFSIAGGIGLAYLISAAARGLRPTGFPRA